MRHVPDIITVLLPSDSFGFTDVGVPSGFILIVVHFRVLHSNPYKPKAPKSPGNIGTYDNSQAKAMMELHKILNFRQFSFVGK